MDKPCIEHGRKSRTYVQVSNGAGGSFYLHVRVWQEANGRAKPEGHHIHHICENKRCIEPTHLVSLPKGEHVRLHQTGTKSVPAEIAEQIRAEHASLPRAERRPRRERTLKSPEGARLPPGSQAMLAAKYGITVNYLKTILRGPRLTGPVPDIGGDQ